MTLKRFFGKMLAILCYLETKKAGRLLSPALYLNFILRNVVRKLLYVLVVDVQRFVQVFPLRR